MDPFLSLSDPTRRPTEGRPGDVLWERLQQTASWSERFAICDEVLGQLAGNGVVPMPLQHSWRALVASKGRLPVARLAADTGYSRQHLTRRFREEFGLGPKLAARVIRFERAHRILRSTPSPSVALVATTCGYFDQAHLHREAMALAGCAPTALLVDPVPSVQAPQELPRAP